MGTIVTLPTDRRRRRATPRTTDQATILLFMGVRYVRDFDPAPAADHPQPAPRALTEAPLELA